MHISFFSIKHIVHSMTGGILRSGILSLRYQHVKICKLYNLIS